MAVVNLKSVAISTGKEYSDTVEMTFTFDANGKITSWEAKGDTKGLDAAFTK